MESLNNIRGKKPSNAARLFRKTIQKEDYCFYCGNKFMKYGLEIEHAIPLSIGGNLNNFQIACKNCHKKKTLFDKNFIWFLKKTELLIKVGEFNYLIKNKEKIVEIYEKLWEIREK